MEFEISQVVITIVVICLFLWRISFGTYNGLFAEATGFIAVIAAFAAVYYTAQIAGSALGSNFGEIIPRIGYLVIAFVVYRLMTALGNAFRKIKEIPVLGTLDRLLGAVVGVAEAWIMIHVIEFATGYSFINPAIGVFMQIFNDFEKLL